MLMKIEQAIALFPTSAILRYFLYGQKMKPLLPLNLKVSV